MLFIVKSNLIFRQSSTATNLTYFEGRSGQIVVDGELYQDKVLVIVFCAVLKILCYLI